MSKIAPKKSFTKSEKEELNRVLTAARSKYGKYPGVLAVAIGIKYRKRQPIDEVGIAFFVKKKEDKPLKKLPRYLCGRFADGRANLRKRIKTDVIEVGGVEPACRAGSNVYSFTERGTITLLFRNKIPSDSSHYIISCSHVAGGMTESPPDDTDLGSDCCPVYPFATIVKNSVKGPVMPYDIALARLTDQATGALGPDLPSLDGAVLGTSVPLRKIPPSTQIGTNMEVQCVGDSSGSNTARVSHLGTGHTINYGGMEVSVSDLFTLDLRVEGGDSGGLVYRGQTAIGILVAKSRDGGWGWFHPLDNALTYLNSLDPNLPLKIF